MAGSIVFEEQIAIPLQLRTLAEFRRWATSDASPEQCRIDYIAGRIEVDMSPEDLHTHGKLKVELVRVLADRVKRLKSGELYSDRTRVSCPLADLSTEPDLVFVSEESLDSGRVKLIPRASGAPDRYVELEGPPDLIVEIVSDVSVRKDTRRLPGRYFRAGVSEFWLVDARGPAPLLFRIHRRGKAGYQPVNPDADGYQHSAVLDCCYRLDRSRNPRGRLTFDLRTRKG